MEPSDLKIIRKMLAQEKLDAQDVLAKRVELVGMKAMGTHNRDKQ